MTKQMKSYCKHCKRIVDKEESVCSHCGGKEIVFGEGFHWFVESEEVTGIECDCGNRKLKMIAFADLGKIAVINLECKCGNVIGIQHTK